MTKQILFSLLMLGPTLNSYAQSDNADGQWISLFNGSDLSNWVVKFTGHEAGDNYRDSFRVDDGVLKVSYDNWPDFNNEFGHLFYDEVFSHYRLRVEYRFVGDQVSAGPAWAFRNNGLMLHSQDPRSMTVAQEFPASIEVQLLGGNGTDSRPTANVCSPGTHYVWQGELVTRHCTNSSSQTFHGDQWVTLEVEVRGDESIKHWINGELVFDYAQTQLDEGDADALRLIAAGQVVALDRGYIAIQAESHPTEFRKIELQRLEP